MIIFVLAGAALLYTYFLYPLLLLAIGKDRTRTTESLKDESLLPSVSVIIPFHDEERWVSRKLEDTLSWDYPRDRLEVIAVSDGSTDRTNEILNAYKDRVRVVLYHPRRGKPTALNAGVAEARGEILVFTDANVLLEPKAIRAMAACYGDPSVGGVSGNVALQADGSHEPLGEGLYMRYERWLYALDSRVQTMVGADGALFSIRRELCSPLPRDTIVDDFVLALEVISEGKRVVYEPDARGIEMVVPDVRAEFLRKVRMVAGGYEALWRFRYLLNPLRYPKVTFQLLSHKLMRWMVPLFLIVALVSSVIAAQAQPVLAGAVALQVAFYALGGLGWISAAARRWTPVYVPYYFCAVNIAAAVGFWRFLRGRQAITWQKVSR